MEVWEANPTATDRHFEDLAVSMLNILTQFQAYAPNWRNPVGVSRVVSVELRKVLLHNGLLQRCVRRPRLHRLVSPAQLMGDPFENAFRTNGGQMTIIKRDEPMAGTQAVVEYAPIEHTTVIHPLYGLCFRKNVSQWVSEDPFDEKAPPISLNEWLEQPALQVDRDIYTMRHLLSEVANTQGAHSDHKNDTIRQQVQRNFWGMYLNIFILRVGIYLYNHFALSVSAKGSLFERISKVDPEMAEENYQVSATLEFDMSQFAPHSELTLRPIAVAQELPLVSGVPVGKPEQSAREPIISRFEIRAPAL